MRKILVVDDEAEILTALEDLFEDEYDVVSTTSPAEALRLLEETPDISVIISDQRMPELPGDQFLARARRISRAPAILLTGYADINTVIAAINTGWVAGYTHKPWDPEVLRSMVANARQRFLLQTALDLERSLLHGLMDNSGNAVSFKDAKGRFVRLNKLKAELVGASVEDCLGRRETEFLDAERAANLERMEAHVVARRRAVEVIEEQIDPTGQTGTRWFAVSRFPVLDEAGHCTHIGTIHRDITEQRLMEERLRQADKMEALGTLAGGVAHDFNNLLMVIQGNIDLAMRKLAGRPELERTLNNLANAGSAAKRGAALTSRLLTFSRRKDMKTAPINLNDVVRGMSNLLERTLGGMITFAADLEEGLWLTHGDPEQLELGILNLCINARDAMPEGGSITITTRNVTQEDNGRLREFVRLVVTDTGHGMSPAVQKRALEPFFSTKAANGTGLGLSMVYGMTQQLGGTMSIESEEGAGTSIDLHLPRAQVSGQSEDETAASVAPSSTAQPLHVLLVDDDDHVREVTAELVTGLGHRLSQAASAMEALGILEKGGDIGLIIADFAMPGITGIELANRAREQRPDLPVLIITGHAPFETLPEGVNLLEKPFNGDQLTAAIGQALGAAPARS